MKKTDDNEIRVAKIAISYFCLFLPFAVFLALIFVRLFSGLVQEPLNTLNVFTTLVAILCGVLTFLVISSPKYEKRVIILKFTTLIVLSVLYAVYVALLLTGYVGWAAFLSTGVFISAANHGVAGTLIIVLFFVVLIGVVGYLTRKKEE
ncbi:MAG: YpbF family protein [Firmicutes bacterium]|nr:YpbF family protein [Bacillota bacterium]